jgi:tRNA-splicing ligase RtcB (3'-phosphate/5'-hydroxy nucleic acid ligase)
MTTGPKITGKDLIALGYHPARWFSAALVEIGDITDEARIRAICDRLMPPPSIARHATPAPFDLFITAESADEQSQIDQIVAGFSELMRTPTVIQGVLMPDACEAGPKGTIPVGGVAIADRAIHPGMHSADICCSMFVSVIDGVEPADLMDALQAVTHFGPGGRDDGRFALPDDLRCKMLSNPYLRHPKIMAAACAHLGTAGDGNHFQSVGIIGGHVAITSHHGSRGVGAMLFKQGMAVAEGFRQILSPDTMPVNAWIPFETQEGRDYWEALLITRDWTKLNHRLIHDAAIDALGGRVVDRFWNEHNFVFQSGDQFIHAKGATPVDPALSPDSDPRRIIPMNLSEPILIVQAGGNSLGFAPHGAGRHLSRRAYQRQVRAGGKTEAALLSEAAHAIDLRFFSGLPDITELPAAYKPAAKILAAMTQFNLACITDRIWPFGTIMAGDWERNAPWRRG